MKSRVVIAQKTFFSGFGDLLRRCKFYKFYEGWNFNSGNYLFTTDTK